ncbi:hypothetical protein [Bradyrhizobium sp. JYMT SZCCT0428]|uniref:hypothetical protein n=1 Tax=Bradyrhizobium sp. JYMT SZCCT0428 TaxID=2807673 RepID=UPI001BAB8FF8|nr:hypothetical protein [Bradyrhizobium sp. JYMT SZCCT0428]MBR1151558.1 hypothetical protein [Bradyrhizobium sp. JYMT SZCCT0428]
MFDHLVDERKQACRYSTGQNAALIAPKSNFRFTPESGLHPGITPCLKGADFVAKVS